MKWSPEELISGGIIRAKIGSIYHYGIFVSEDEVIAFGYPPVNLRAVRDEDVRVVSTDIETFLAGSFAERGIPDASEKRRMRAPEEIIASARVGIGKGGYSLLHNNCEHFVNECAFGERRSEQETKARERWNKRPQLSVFFTEIPEGLKIEKLYPPSRNREILFARNPAVKRQRYAVWKLLMAAVGRSFGYDFNSLRFEKSREGKWSADGFEFSLSHTDVWCAAAVSNEACGVDIEDASQRGAYASSSPEKLERLYRRVLTEREKAEKKTPPSTEDFLLYWTRKESIFKTGGEKQFIPDRIDTADYPVRTFRLRDFPDLILSVSGAQTPMCSLFYVEGEIIRRLSADEFEEIRPEEGL